MTVTVGVSFQTPASARRVVLILEATQGRADALHCLILARILAQHAVVWCAKSRWKTISCQMIHTVLAMIVELHLALCNAIFMTNVQPCAAQQITSTG